MALTLMVAPWLGASWCITACATPAARVEPATQPVSARTPGAPATSPAAVEERPATPAVEEASVRPGINDNYVGQPKIGRWRQRFEREGREVFDHRDEILEALALTPGMSVADVGAGTGLFTFPIARRVGAEGRVYAVDLMPYFLEHIAAEARARGLTQVVTVQAQERGANLPAGAVDLVFTSDAYHHLEYPRAYLASLFRALRPGGTLVVIDYERIEGKTEKWLLEHVRAGKDVVRAEIEDAGFQLKADVPLLTDNYFLTFRRP